MKPYTTEDTVTSVFKRISRRMNSKPSKTPGESAKPEPTKPQDMIHNRIALFAKDNPEALDYVLQDEQEAAELLSAMCASLDLMSMERTSAPAKERMRYRSESRRLKGVIHRNGALEYAVGGDFLFCGKKLVKA